MLCMQPIEAITMKTLDAYKLTATVHACQVDKAGRPYIENLSSVFVRGLEKGGDRGQQVAALLHDAIEAAHQPSRIS